MKVGRVVCGQGGRLGRGRGRSGESPALQWIAPLVALLLLLLLLLLPL